MEFLLPKINWKNGEVFSFDIDYERIKNNILFLYQLSKQLFLPFTLLDIKSYATDDLIYQDFFKSIDKNIDKILLHTFCRKSQILGKEWLDNGFVFNADELNRIENAMLSLHTDYISAIQNMQTISFVLGGGLFGSTI